MISGWINQAREPLVRVSPVGLGEPLEAIVDTGFTGALLIPRGVADRMGLRIRATGYFALADGRTAAALIARGRISWFEKERSIDILVVEAGDVLLGVELLDGYRLIIDFGRDELSITEDGK